MLKFTRKFFLYLTQDVDISVMIFFILRNLAAKRWICFQAVRLNGIKFFKAKHLGTASLGKVTVKVEKYECHSLQNISIMLQWVSKIFMKFMPKIHD